MNKVILASASPRRKELLKQIGIEFEVCVSTCEEKITKTIPAEVVCELSAQKALDVWQKVKVDSKVAVSDATGQQNVADKQSPIVIGADTVVAYDGKILGKPADKEDAVRMLSMLSGNTHEVYTGVTFCYAESGTEKVHTFYERTAVTFYPMSWEEIVNYVASGDPMDKAGAYGIQGSFAAYVKGIEGDYNNVVGLPIGRLYQEIKELLDK
ncbi:MAG: septum formation protein Maf [Lachnospiraceae bacterium]|nr:septum formation protein Maf [Lachnospiraceae bacterium]MBQ7780517.1 septum formation protein Maf [Lachnospiraceae bacterium]